MRSVLFLLGLLLPFSVSAEALSPWVREVLKRSEDGIGVAQSIDYTNCDPASLLSDHQANQSIFGEFADVRLDFGADATFLRERTVCFESDRKALKDQIIKIADAMLQETKSCKLGTAALLRKNYGFLMMAYRDFLAGGIDPSYKTRLLMSRWAFHYRELYDQDIEAEFDEDAPEDWQCPFTTDYGAHAIAYVPLEPGSGGSEEDLEVRSYGCDQSVLDRITDEPLKKEATTLKNFLNDTDDAARALYSTLQDALYALGSALSSRTDGWAPPELPDVPESPPEHATLSGCLRPEEPVEGRHTDEEIEALLHTYPDYFEEENLQERTIGGQTVWSFGPDQEHRLPIGLLFQPSLDYFSVEPSSLSLLRTYAERRARNAAERPLSSYFTPKILDNIFAIFENIMKDPKDVKEVEASVEEESAFLDSAIRDASQRMHSAGDSLEDALQSLLAVTNSEDGLLPTSYIPDLTYFLARSCVDGYCQETLETVAKRTFNPYCTPYASGKFTEEDAALRCFCDASVEDSWGEWDRYCSENINYGNYSGRQDEVSLACFEPA